MKSSERAFMARRAALFSWYLNATYKTVQKWMDDGEAAGKAGVLKLSTSFFKNVSVRLNCNAGMQHSFCKNIFYSTVGLGVSLAHR